MPSTVIRSVAYDTRSRRLTIQFVGGREYVYDEFPEDLYHLFRNARSKGEFFNAAIRGRYPFREVATARLVSSA